MSMWSNPSQKLMNHWRGIVIGFFCAQIHAISGDRCTHTKRKNPEWSRKSEWNTENEHWKNRTITHVKQPRRRRSRSSAFNSVKMRFNEGRIDSKSFVHNWLPSNLLSASVRCLEFLNENYHTNSASSAARTGGLAQRFKGVNECSFAEITKQFFWDQVQVVRILCSSLRIIWMFVICKRKLLVFVGPPGGIKAALSSKSATSVLS